MKIYNNMLELIGKTPLMEFAKYGETQNVSAKILGKLEYLNPSGSVKDRAALYMIEDAEKSDKLTKGSVIIEPTSGNTGIGLAAVAAYKGYETILVMPDTMSLERRQLLQAYGAKLVLTEGKKGMQGAIDKAEELAKETPNSFIPAQFDNVANIKAHTQTTAEEIWQDTDGQVDIVVAGVGTGGTLMGIGTALKTKNPAVKVVAVEPELSPLLSGGTPAPHPIQGIGANFIPSLVNLEIIDEVLQVAGDDAYTAMLSAVKTEGVLLGISAGAALHAATILGKRPENKNKNIVVILPDGGNKYLSTGIFDK